MISIKKLVPGRLSRAILARAWMTGNGRINSINDAGTVTIQSNDSIDALETVAETATLNRRITITVETERLLVLRETRLISKRREEK